MPRHQAHFLCFEITDDWGHSLSCLNFAGWSEGVSQRDVFINFIAEQLLTRAHAAKHADHPASKVSGMKWENWLARTER